MPNITHLLYPAKLTLIFIAILMSITMLQSGIDKLMNIKDNTDWFKDKFKNTFLNKIVVPIFWILTIQEILIGLLFLFNVVSIIFVGIDYSFLLYIASTLLIIQLFFGQRISKDYEGAAGILPYFIISIIGLILS